MDFGLVKTVCLIAAPPVVVVVTYFRNSFYDVNWPKKKHILPLIGILYLFELILLYLHEYM